MEFDELKNPELQKKLMAAKTTEEQLQAIAGGGGWYCSDRSCYENTCPLAT